MDPWCVDSSCSSIPPALVLPCARAPGKGKIIHRPRLQ
uniref:Uncharacterized protein n=1 Tax=Arundo donax TaxID=35708 RepID=A0A0A9EMI1_ARUDO